MNLKKGKLQIHEIIFCFQHDRGTEQNDYGSKQENRSSEQTNYRLGEKSRIDIEFFRRKVLN